MNPMDTVARGPAILDIMETGASTVGEFLLFIYSAYIYLIRFLQLPFTLW
jgi:hypothetical protein